MDNLDKMAKELEKEMRMEAVQRLKTLKPNNLELAKEFGESGKVYVQDLSIYTSSTNRLREATKAEMDLVHYLENEHGCLPYFMLVETKEIDTIYHLFYVNWDKRQWSVERSSLQKYGKPYSEPYVFFVNAGFRDKDDETHIDTLLSKFTMIQINLD